MSGQRFEKAAAPAAALAALLMAELACAFPPFGPPPALPAFRPPAPPAFRPAMPSAPAFRPSAFRPSAPRPGGLSPAGRPAVAPSAAFARPTINPSRAALLARPNVGGLAAHAGRRPGGWAPPSSHRDWGRPSANLVAGGRSATFNRASAGALARRASRWDSSYRWYRYRPIYGVGGYYGYSGDGGYYGGSYSYPDSSAYFSTYYLNGGAESAGDTSSSGSYSAPGDEGAAKADRETAAAERYMVEARRAFVKGDYPESQRQCERAIGQLPGDANLREFRALCQFARGQYQDAAGTLYDVLAAGPGWDWDTINSFYPTARAYTAHLRALERHVKDHPTEAAGHFVLAYHYLALGERDAAAAQLREAVKYQPGDQVSPGILEALQKSGARALTGR